MTRCPTSPRVVVKPILPVDDMTSAAGFYGDLGFDVDPYDEGYTIVRQSGEEIFHLRLVADLEPVGNAASVYFHVRDVDAVHREWVARGIDAGVPVDEPWGMREFSVTDPAGNLIRVGQNS